ncbi:MAG: hypothetical protein MZV70_24260 [Desulfobacterales bacterium]|nr:hypothetical protein [Desulfobacterales bacterium]
MSVLIQNGLFGEKLSVHLSDGIFNPLHVGQERKTDDIDLSSICVYPFCSALIGHWMFMMNYMKLASVFQGNIYTTSAACGVDVCRRVRLVLITG